MPKTDDVTLTIRVSGESRDVLLFQSGLMVFMDEAGKVHGVRIAVMTDKTKDAPSTIPFIAGTLDPY